VNETNPLVAEPLRTSDLVPLRRMLGTDSVVFRVNPDGSFAPFERMPSLFFERPIRRILNADDSQRFDQACGQVIAERRSMAFRPSTQSTDEVMINPILDDDGSACRFIICWVRHTEIFDPGRSNRLWADLQLEDVGTRYRLRTDRESVAIEAAPWWALKSGELLELWPHHPHVSATGLGHAVMEALIIDAVEAATLSGGPAVRIAIPSGDMLAGLVPVFHGAIRASGIDPARVVVAVDVELAVDPDLLPIIVHLRTMGMQIDIVGLDSLMTTLQTVSDTSLQTPKFTPASAVETGPWGMSFDTAIIRAA